jgi:prevent-host-death family protein
MVTVMKAGPKRPSHPASISAAEFKAKCLDLMDSVSETGASIVITKRGRSVAMLAPVRPSRNSLRGIMKGRIRVIGDIVSPVDVVSALHQDGRKFQAGRRTCGPDAGRWRGTTAVIRGNGAWRHAVVW